MGYPYESYQMALGGRLTTGVKWLLISNAGVFLLQQIIGPELIYWFGLSAQQVIGKFAIWQFGTYLFLHGSLVHLFFNMFALWIFGGEIERHWGTRAFVKYYFITGIGAGLVAFLFNLSSDIPIVGASGAVYGVLLAFGVMFPNRVITLLFMLFIPVSMKAKYLVMMFISMSVLGGVSKLFGTGDGVAHFAHLGGAAIGYFYLKSDWKIDSHIKKLFQKRRPRPPHMGIHRYEKDKYMQKQVDEILDKINEIGYENLTEAEKDILKQASDHLSNKSDD